MRLVRVVFKQLSSIAIIFLQVVLIVLETSRRLKCLFKGLHRILIRRQVRRRCMKWVETERWFLIDKLSCCSEVNQWLFVSKLTI